MLTISKANTFCQRDGCAQPAVINNFTVTNDGELSVIDSCAKHAAKLFGMSEKYIQRVLKSRGWCSNCKEEHYCHFNRTRPNGNAHKAICYSCDFKFKISDNSQTGAIGDVGNYLGMS